MRVGTGQGGEFTAMHIEYVYLRPMRVLYARAYGPYAKSSHAAWDQMLSWLDARNGRSLVQRGIGAMQDDPRAVGPYQRRYDACVEIKPGISVDARAFIGRQVLAGGAYAMHRLTGHPEQLRDTFQALRREWVAADGLTIDPKRAFLEIYMSDPAIVPENQQQFAVGIPVLADSRHMAIDELTWRQSA